ncbi:MAG TPA: DedA family protein [Amycolatopsis sp.]|nr:DedA family protein [Amycolatopsis sp.]
MAELLDVLAELLRGALDSPWLWVIVFAVAGLDALLPFMPSETTVVTVAVLLGLDLPRLALLAGVAAIGAWSGDCLSHEIGRRAGPAVLDRLLRPWPTSSRESASTGRYEWVRARVDRHCALLIIVARYLPGGRVACGLATGGAGVGRLRFAAIDLVGAGIWAAYSVCVGCAGRAGFAGEPGKGLLLAFAIGVLIAAAVAAGGRIRSRHAARSVRGADPEPVHGLAVRRDTGGT